MLVSQNFYRFLVSVWLSSFHRFADESQIRFVAYGTPQAWLTHWPLGDMVIISKVWFSNSLYNTVAWLQVVKLSLGKMPQKLTSEKSTLVQVMVWCHQATSHYLSQHWPRSMSPCSVTRPQWVNFRSCTAEFLLFLGLMAWRHQAINTLRPRQNGRHFADDILKWIFLNENVWIPIEISLKFVPKGPIDYIPALV